MGKSRKYIKKKKYFIGGLLKKAASLTPVGMAVNALRKKKGGSGEGSEVQEGAEAQDNNGKILKVKVIGESGDSQSTAKKTAEAAVKAKEDGIKPIKSGANDTTKMKKGGMAKCRKYVKGGNVKTMEQDLLEGAGVSDSKRHKNKMKGILHSKEKALYIALGRKAPKRNIFKKGAVVNETNDKEGYNFWKKNISTRTKENISPKVDRKSKISKHYEENVDPDSSKAIKKAKHVQKENLRGTTLEPGNQELLLEAKRGNIKKKGLVRGLFNRKTEKGLVKKKYDDEIYEDSEVIPGARADKFSSSDRKEENKVGREQRKYIQSGSDHEGDPIKTKEKIKGIKGRDIPTEKHKEKMINENERKFVDVVDGKRVKKRGSSASTAREYTRRGFRRVYVEPDSEGNVQYVGTGKKATKKADKENKKAIKEENKIIKQQKKKEKKARKKKNREEFRKNLSDPGRYSESAKYNEDSYYKKGGSVKRKYIS